ncbi:MAG: hypothetical protein NVSMB21_23350 [Vulcanimicrobiaceae bacterium]
MKRYVPVLAGLAIVAALATGCSKSGSSESSAAGAKGPITDAGSTGLRPVAGAKVAAGDAKHGMAIFGQNCSSCHGAAGAGGGIGPSLKGEKARKDTTAAIAWIKNPAPPMPKLYPAPLNESDVADVAAYVESL